VDNSPVTLRLFSSPSSEGMSCNSGGVSPSPPPPALCGSSLCLVSLASCGVEAEQGRGGAAQPPPSPAADGCASQQAAAAVAADTTATHTPESEDTPSDNAMMDMRDAVDDPRDGPSVPALEAREARFQPAEPTRPLRLRASRSHSPLPMPSPPATDVTLNAAAVAALAVPRAATPGDIPPSAANCARLPARSDSSVSQTPTETLPSASPSRSSNSSRSSSANSSTSSTTRKLSVSLALTRDGSVDVGQPALFSPARLSPSDTQRRLTDIQRYLALPSDHPYLCSFRDQLTRALGVEEAFDEARETLPPLDLEELTGDPVASAAAAAAPPGTQPSASSTRGITARPTHRHRRTLSNQVTIVPAMLFPHSGSNAPSQNVSTANTAANTPTTGSAPQPYPPRPSSALAMLEPAALPAGALALALSNGAGTPSSTRSLFPSRRGSESGVGSAAAAAAAASAAAAATAGAATPSPAHSATNSTDISMLAALAASQANGGLSALSTPTVQSQPSTSPASAVNTPLTAAVAAPPLNPLRYSDTTPAFAAYRRAWEAAHHLFLSLQRLGHPPHYSRSFFYSPPPFAAPSPTALRVTPLTSPRHGSSPDPADVASVISPRFGLERTLSLPVNQAAPGQERGSPQPTTSPRNADVPHHRRRGSTNMLVPNYSSGDHQQQKQAPVLQQPPQAASNQGRTGVTVNTAGESPSSTPAGGTSSSSTVPAATTPGGNGTPVAPRIPQFSKRSTMPMLLGWPAAAALATSPQGGNMFAAAFAASAAGLPPPHTSAASMLSSPEASGMPSGMPPRSFVRRGSFSTKTPSGSSPAPVTSPPPPGGMSPVPGSLPSSPEPAVVVGGSPLAGLPAELPPAAEGTALAMMQQQHQQSLRAMASPVLSTPSISAFARHTRMDSTVSNSVNSTPLSPASSSRSLSTHTFESWGLPGGSVSLFAPAASMGGGVGTGDLSLPPSSSSSSGAGQAGVASSLSLLSRLSVLSEAASPPSTAASSPLNTPDQLLDG